MKYFLEEEDKKHVRLVSVIDGKEVEATGFIREATASRHMKMYDVDSRLNTVQNDYRKACEPYNNAVANLTADTDPALLESLIEQVRVALEVLQSELPKIWREMALIAIDFSGKEPEEAFFASEGFEYNRLYRVRDFFLNGLRK